MLSPTDDFVDCCFFPFSLAPHLLIMLCFRPSMASKLSSDAVNCPMRASFAFLVDHKMVISKKNKSKLTLFGFCTASLPARPSLPLAPSWPSQPAPLLLFLRRNFVSFRIRKVYGLYSYHFPYSKRDLIFNNC